MNVIFACGGTGGHINPAIAVANIWKERYPDSNIMFIGGEGGLEQQLVPKAGFKLFSVPADSFDRRKSLQGIRQNIKAVCSNIRSIQMCKKAIREFGALKPEALGCVTPENPVLTVKMENNATLLLELTPVK